MRPRARGHLFGRACPDYALALGGDVDAATLRRLAGQGEIADLTWEAPDDHAAEHARVFQAAIAGFREAAGANLPPKLRPQPQMPDRNSSRLGQRNQDPVVKRSAGYRTRRSMKCLSVTAPSATEIHLPTTGGSFQSALSARPKLGSPVP
jgi:hypothetical protein